MGPIHTRMGRDAVIYCHDKLRPTGVRLVHNLGAQAVTVFKTIWHQVVNVTAAQRAHRQDA